MWGELDRRFGGWRWVVEVMEGLRGRKRRCCDCWLGSDKEMDQVLSLCCLSNEKLSNLLIRKGAFFL
jgi:hypothetical protein